MFILYAYIVVAGTYPFPVKEWRNLGEFSNTKACIAAADEMKIPVFKCISKS